MRYRLSPLAEQDLRDLWAYVAEESGEERSDTVLDAIVERIEMLAAYPRAGRRRPEFGAGVRSIAVEATSSTTGKRTESSRSLAFCTGAAISLRRGTRNAAPTIRNREPWFRDWIPTRGPWLLGPTTQRIGAMSSL